MMNAFDEKLVRKALDLHQEVGLDPSDDDRTRLWHLLRSVVEFCAAEKIDYYALWADVLDDYRADQPPSVRRRA